MTKNVSRTSDTFQVAITLTTDVVCDRFFALEARLGSFVHMWHQAIASRDPVIRCRLDEETFTDALVDGWIISDEFGGDGFGSHHRLTGPGRDPEWLLAGSGRRYTGRWTYAIEATGAQLVKIGRSVDVGARLLKLQTGSPHRLVILGRVRRDIERKVHAAMDGYRVHGEWFRMNDESRLVLREHGLMGAK